MSTPDDEPIQYEEEKDSQEPEKQNWRLIAWICIAVVMVVSVVLFYVFNNRSISYLSEKKGIVIANFMRGGTNNFNSDIRKAIEGGFRDSTIEIKEKDTFIFLGTEDKQLVNLLNTYNGGIVVFGAIDPSVPGHEPTFHCRIFLHKMSDTCIGVTRRDSLIQIDDPRDIKFDIGNRAQVIGKFVKSILYYHQCKWEESSGLLDYLIYQDSSVDDKSFKSYCCLLKGNTAVHKGDTDLAMQWYRKAREYDSSIQELNNNYRSLIKANPKLADGAFVKQAENPKDPELLFASLYIKTLAPSFKESGSNFTIAAYTQNGKEIISPQIPEKVDKQYDSSSTRDFFVNTNKISKSECANFKVRVQFTSAAGTNDSWQFNAKLVLRFKGSNLTANKDSIKVDKKNNVVEFQQKL